MTILQTKSKFNSSYFDFIYFFRQTLEYNQHIINVDKMQRVLCILDKAMTFKVLEGNN